MKLEDIGFYTLSDKRAKEVSWTSDLQRCELILTDKCNFNCPYCRGIKKKYQGHLDLNRAKRVIDVWAEGKLHNIRFSGGEPTLYPNLKELVRYTANKPSINRIAISTNGSASINRYKELADLGVNDFSISLDSCCSMITDIMTGTKGKFDKITKNINELGKYTYVTVGIVLDNSNKDSLNDIINFAEGLNISDIRIIPSAQSNHFLNVAINTDKKILKYRVNNIQKGRHVRGIRKTDCKKCHLVKDDMAILNDYHFPCIIYMRERGNPIGKVGKLSIEKIRKQRQEWFNKHNSQTDPICSKNCLDVCIDHNNKVEYYENNG